MPPIDETIALAPLAGRLKRCFRYDPPRGYGAGKRRISGLVAQFFDCPRHRARRIVERLEARGFLYALDDGRDARWAFDPEPFL